MRFHVDIDRVADGRPEGRVRSEADDTPLTFSGWVELLRQMEHRWERGDGDTGPGTDTTERVHP